MGTPKAWLPFGDERLLQRVVRIVGEVVSPVVVAGKDGLDLPPLPDDCIRASDAPGAVGPLAGIAAGLDALKGRRDAALVVACDHALISTVVLRRLIEHLDDYDAAVCRQEGRLFPTLAVYRLTLRPTLADVLTGGDPRATAWIARINARLVDAEEFRSVDPRLDALRNVNTPDDYREAQNIAGRTTTS